MKFIVILALIALTQSFTFTMTSDSQCSCSQLVTKADCDWGCMWDSTASTCSDFACSSLTTESTCDASFTCAWTNAGACADFTKCADYSVDVNTKCALKGYCQPSAAATAGKFACSDVPVTPPTYVVCGSFTTEAACSGMSAAETYCAWKAGASPAVCASLSAKTCADSSQFSDAWCDDDQCKWDNTAKTCSAIACADISGQSQCDSIDVMGTDDYIVCKWDSTSKCIDAPDVSHLTASTCLSTTYGEYYWDSSSSACTDCAFGTIISGVMMAAMLLLA